LTKKSCDVKEERKLEKNVRVEEVMCPGSLRPRRHERTMATMQLQMEGRNGAKGGGTGEQKQQPPPQTPRLTTLNMKRVEGVTWQATVRKVENRCPFRQGVPTGKKQRSVHTIRFRSGAERGWRGGVTPSVKGRMGGGGERTNNLGRDLF